MRGAVIAPATKAVNLLPGRNWADVCFPRWRGWPLQGLESGREVADDDLGSGDCRVDAGGGFLSGSDRLLSRPPYKLVGVGWLISTR